MTLLAINWGEFGVKAGQFILSFSIIVVLHELGHFLPAKWFKCRVEKFYLFFNPWFSLFKKRVGETEYGLGWVPFGGYVKISGMIDESMDKDQLKQAPQPWEFRSKPAWQRLIIMVGGVFVNLVLGFLIYAAMLWHWGDSYTATNKLTYGIATDSLAQSIGLKDGDNILKVDGKYIEKFDKIFQDVILKDVTSLEVVRNGEKINIAVPKDFTGKLVSYKSRFIGVRYPATSIDSIVTGSLANKAGLRKNDQIISVNGVNTAFFGDVKNILSTRKNKEVDLLVLRSADTLQKKATVSADGTIGIVWKLPTDEIGRITTKYSFLESIPAGINKSIETLKFYWLNLKLLFSSKVKASESLGSVISIGKMFPPTWSWPTFWGLTAFFSLVLALMNILPIPALDGGHAMFTLYEMVSGRKPSDKFIEYAQMAGMVLLLGLMAYALGLDIFRLFK